MNVPFEFINAVDASKVSLSKHCVEIGHDLVQLDPLSYLGKNPGLKAGEIGCAAGHLKIYKKMIAEGIECACVLEDDVILADEFSAILSSERLSNMDWELVLLGHYSAPHKCRDRGGDTKIWRQRVMAKYRLGIPIDICFSAVGYLIRRSGAIKLYEYGRPIRMAADLLTATSVRAGVKLKVLNPTCVRPAPGFATTIPGRVRARPPRHPQNRVGVAFTRSKNKIGIGRNDYWKRGREIYLLWPTVRPEVFKQAHKQWLESAEFPRRVNTLVAVNTNKDAELLRNYYTITVDADQVGVCKPAYRLCRELRKESSAWRIHDQDIVVLPSDDFRAPLDWDTFLEKKLKPAKTAALFVRDGYQAPDPKDWHTSPCITLPIMTFGCLKAMNYIIYHPDYVHMESDVELYEVLNQLGVLIDDRIEDETTFVHHHFVCGLRERDRWDDQWRSGGVPDRDRNTYEKRKQMTLQEKLQVTDNVPA